MLTVANNTFMLSVIMLDVVMLTGLVDHLLVPTILDQLLFKFKIVFVFVTKHSTLMGRSTLLCPPIFYYF
jgi:hypothetical protein